MKLRTAVALILTAAVLAGGGAWAAEGWFPDVPDDHRRIDAIRYAKTEGLFQGFPDGNMRPDDELSEGQFIKVAERLYDRYDVWTRADWAQVMYGGLPSLTNTPPPVTTAAPATTAPATIPVATVPGIGSPCGWPLGPPQRISAATAPPAQIRFSVRPCAPPVTYRVEFNGGQMFNLPYRTAAQGFTPPLAWPASLTTGTVRVTEYRPGGPANGKVLGETKIPWDSVLSRPPAPTTTTTTTTAPTTTTTRALAVPIPKPPIPEVPYEERDVIVHYFGYRGSEEAGDTDFVVFYVADPDGPTHLPASRARVSYILEVFTTSGGVYNSPYGRFDMYGSSSLRSPFYIYSFGIPSDWEDIRMRLAEPTVANGREVPPHPFRSVTFVEVKPPAAECVPAFRNLSRHGGTYLYETWGLFYRPECNPAEWDEWWGVRANAPAEQPPDAG